MVIHHNTASSTDTEKKLRTVDLTRYCLPQGAIGPGHRGPDQQVQRALPRRLGLTQAGERLDLWGSLLH